MVGAITVVEVIITDGAEATITVGDIITIGEISERCRLSWRPLSFCL
jgi:hypothetical protein